MERAFAKDASDKTAKSVYIRMKTGLEDGPMDPKCFLPSSLVIATLQVC